MTFWGLVYIRGGVWADRGAEFELLPMKMDLFTNIFMFINIKFSVVSVGGVCVVTSVQLSAVRIFNHLFPVPIFTVNKVHYHHGSGCSQFLSLLNAIVWATTLFFLVIFVEFL